MEPGVDQSLRFNFLALWSSRPAALLFHSSVEGGEWRVLVACGRQGFRFFLGGGMGVAENVGGHHAVLRLAST